jgi:sec-independent protein translocase protein TatB
MDFSWSELLVIGIVALIFIGPKDLPGMFQQLGRFMAKVRAMGREFSRAMEQAAKETGVKDVAKDLNAVVDPLRKAANPSSMGLDAVKSAADKFEKWDPLKNAAKPTQPLTVGKPLTPPPMPPVATAPADAGAAAAVAAAEAVPAAVPAAAAAAMAGPNTAALAGKVAARRAAAAEAAEKLRATAAAAAPGPAIAAPAIAAPDPATPARKPGRQRKKADKPAGDAT